MAMKLSEAIQAGATLLKTTGPHFTKGDCLTAAQAGLLGRLPTEQESNDFYWQNQFNATAFTDLEYWMRMAVIFKYRWADVITKLRRYE